MRLLTTSEFVEKALAALDDLQKRVERLMGKGSEDVEKDEDD